MIINNGMYETKLIKNFLSQSQIETLRELVKKNNSTEVVESPIGKYLGVSNEIHYFLNNVIETLPGEVLYAKILDANIPGGPHADTSLPNPIPPNYKLPNFGRTFIIPIDSVNTHTILFNESVPAGEDTIHYIDNVLPQLTESISDDIYTRYLTHCPKFWRNKLSIDKIFPWESGDMLIFDRNKLHCSDNYLVNNLNNKKGFVIWSEFLT